MLNLQRDYVGLGWAKVFTTSLSRPRDEGTAPILSKLFWVRAEVGSGGASRTGPHKYIHGSCLSTLR